MLHYLFTNDLRRNMWPGILVESAKLIRDDKVPDQHEDKSKNNYINTQQSYLCIHKGTKANAACCNGDVNAVILNFVNRFQYPNARTFESYNQSKTDGMAVAPLRLAVQLLFILKLIDEKEGHISYGELSKYIICNVGVVTGNMDVLSLAQQIISDRKNGVDASVVPSTEMLNDCGVEWKHCPRQIKELFGLLEYVPFIQTDDSDFRLVMPSGLDPLEAKFFFNIVNNKEIWISASGSWQEIQDSYRVYMDEGISLYLSAKENHESKKNYEEEFVSWWVNVEKKEENTARNKYLVYLRCLNKPYAEPSHSTWPGIFPFLFGEKSEKEVVEVGELAEFDALFAPFCSIFNEGGCPDGANPVAYEKCVKWVKDVSKWACLHSAFKAYRKFLEWRETQKKPVDENNGLPPNVDRLSVALKLFEEQRKEKGDGGWFDVGRSVNGRIREYFDSLTVEALKDFNEAKIAELFCGIKDADGKTFETMWSGKNGQGWGNIKPDNEQAVKEIVDFLVKLKTDTVVVDQFLKTGFTRPKGFGRSVITELLMKFHPESCIKHGERSHNALAWLGLIDFSWKNDYSETEYKVVCGAAAKILQKMKAMKLSREINADGTESNAAPDYLTVNEFIYFVDTNMVLIKEKVMLKKWKPVNSKAKIKNGSKKLDDAFKDDGMLKRLAAALRTKPFAILAGHSGTGKSQLVRRLAYMTCNNDILIEEGNGKSAPGNYCMVQVKPNWHDSTDLLGYYSEMGKRHFVNTPFVEFICKAYAYPDTPFFVCLDEMNLAPVEQYFAEYLSAVESMEKKDGIWVTDALVDVDKTGEKDAAGKEKVDPVIVDQIMKGAASTEAAEWIQKHGLTIPKNLFVVGTVNMDETTCQFSRKVLDRAMTLLMNKVEFSTMAKSKKPSEEELLDPDGIKFFLEGEERGTVGEVESKLLDGINESLVNTPFVVAYRFANEYALYEAALAKLEKVDMATASDDDKKKLAEAALDHVVMMKLLPRIHGVKKTVEEIFSKGRKLGDKTVTGLKSKLPADGLSVPMMDEILARSDEYLTFWP